MENEGLRLSLKEFETWMMRFCFGEICIGWKEPSGCQYGNDKYSIKCKLVIDNNQNPEDYCPIVKFFNWLKEKTET